MTPTDFQRFVIASAYSSARILVTGSQGLNRVLERQRWELSFTYATEPDDNPRKLTVVFGNNVEAVQLTAFGLPVTQDQNAKLAYLSSAAIGEYLDEHGVPQDTQGSLEIPCLPPQLEKWKARKRADEHVTLNYLQNTVYAAWYFELQYVAFDNSDLIRLHASLRWLGQIAEKRKGFYWRYAFNQPDALVLQPLPRIAEVQPTDGALPQTHRKRLALGPETTSRRSEDDMPERSSTRVFVVHGRDSARMNAVARFVQRIGLEPIILHEKPNAGQTLIEKFQANSDVDYAVVLLTPDDLGASRQEIEKADPANVRDVLKPRARQNVYLELGYFLSKLGRGHVGALYVDGVDMPSDYDGVAYIPLDDHEGWHAKLVRELTAAGLAVDLTKL